jgi:hypothetical protein
MVVAVISAGRYAWGLTLLALLVAPLALSAVTVRRRWLADWGGAPARLAEIAIAIAGLVVIAELLGTVGGFRIGWLIAACWIAYGAVRISRPTEEVVSSARDRRRTAAEGSLLASSVAIGVCAGLAVAWLVAVRASLHTGITGPDDLRYHMPFAAGFAQSGFTTHIHYTEDDPLLAFYPATSELLHAIGIAALGNDLLSLVANIGWGALLLLSAWCIGRRSGSAAVAALGGAVVLALPVMVTTQPGQATNDVVGLATFSMALALLACGEGRAPPLILAGGVAGVAASVKLSMLVPAAALLVTAVVGARGARARGATVVAFLITGSFWYLRNWIAAGSPFAPAHLRIGPIHLPAPASPLAHAFDAPVTRYLGNGGVWTSRIEPGLKGAFGPVWWAVLALAAAGIAGALVRRRGLRGPALIGLIAALAYPFIPNTGFLLGQTTVFFAANLRYLTPALLTGFVLIGAAAGPGRRWTWPLIAIEVALIVVALRNFSSVQFSLTTVRWVEIGCVAAVVAGVWLAVGRVQASRRPLRLRPVLGLGVVVLAAILAAGYPLNRSYLRTRYTKPLAYAPFLQPMYAWARTVSQTRIAVWGTTREYPLYGIDDSNRVIYVGRSEPHRGIGPPTDCTSWRLAVNRSHPRYVAIAAIDGVGAAADLTPLIAVKWTQRDSGARQILGTSAVAVFRLSRPLDPARC